MVGGVYGWQGLWLAGSINYNNNLDSDSVARLNSKDYVTLTLKIKLFILKCL